VDLETILISGVVGVVTSAITAYFTSKLKVNEERDKWYRDLSNKYAEALGTNPAVADNLSKQFAIALIVVEGTGRQVGKERKKYFVLPNSRTVVGRDPSCDILIEDPQPSRKQIAFAADGADIFLETLGTKSPVTLNRKPFSGRTRLKNGDEVTIGDTRMELIKLT
jgi:hypothetical protein